MELDTEIGSEPSGPPAEQHDSAPDGTQGGQRTHYKTLEEADAQARRFQSELDKANARLESWEKHLGRWSALGGPEQISQLVGQAVEVAARPDFNDYRAGKLGASKEEDEQDEYLTDEQKEIRNLRRELDSREQQTRNQQGAVNGELAAIRFERAEKEIEAQLGAQWTSRREKVLGEVQRIVSSGAVRSLDAVNAKLLFKCWAASFDSVDEHNAAMTKMVFDQESRRTAAINGKSTMPPTNLSPGAAPTAPARSVKEAFERGMRELAERGISVT